MAGRRAEGRPGRDFRMMLASLVSDRTLRFGGSA
jgi:hypothetical protein